MRRRFLGHLEIEGSDPSRSMKEKMYKFLFKKGPNLISNFSLDFNLK